MKPVSQKKNVSATTTRKTVRSDKTTKQTLEHSTQNTNNIHKPIIQIKRQNQGIKQLGAKRKISVFIVHPK